MAKKAAELKPNDPEINAEYGYQYLYAGKASKALSIFKTHACDRAVAGMIFFLYIKCFQPTTNTKQHKCC